MLQKNFLDFIIKHKLILIFCILYILLGFYTYKDFGITIDESIEYKSSGLLYRSIKDGTSINILSTVLDDTAEEDIKHIPIVSRYFRGHLLIHHFLFEENSYDDFHLLNIVLALPLFIVSYILLYQHFNKSQYAILGPLFLFIDPRIIGHIPANPKDIPFAVYYFIGICLIYFYPKFKNYYFRILLFSVFFTFAQSIRIIGFTLYLVYILNVIYLIKKKQIKWSKDIVYEIIFIFCISNFFSIILWPFLGSSYVKNLLNLTLYTSNFPDWNGSTLYMGKYLTSSEIPWHYMPLYLLVTTPVIFLIFFLLIHIRYKNIFRNRLLFIFWTTIVLNIFMWLFLRPIVYNGYRHFLYLIVLMDFIAAIFTIDLLKSKINKKIKLLIFVPTLIYIFILCRFTIISHPYESIYYNELVGGTKGAYKKFDMDYWFSSRREAANWINGNMDISKEVIYSCGREDFIKYYFRNSLNFKNDVYSNATISICDEKRESMWKIEGDLIYQVKRFGIPLTNVRRLKSIN